MFLFIGFLSVSFVSTAVASGYPESEQWDVRKISHQSQQDKTYYSYLSDKSVSLLERLRNNVSPELADVCSEQRGNQKQCNDFLGNVSDSFSSGAKLSCTHILRSNNRYDAFQVRKKCEKKMWPECLAWKKDWKLQRRLEKNKVKTGSDDQ